MRMAQRAWDQITPQTIQNWFCHTGIIPKLRLTALNTIFASGPSLTQAQIVQKTRLLGTEEQGACTLNDNFCVSNSLENWKLSQLWMESILSSSILSLFQFSKQHTRLVDIMGSSSEKKRKEKLKKKLCLVLEKSRWETFNQLVERHYRNIDQNSESNKTETKTCLCSCGNG